MSYTKARLRAAVVSVFSALALFALAAAPAGAAPSGLLAGGTEGAQLYSLGGTVDITVMPATAGYISELWLQRPDGDIFIARNNQTGTTKTVGPYPNGEELVFYIKVLNTGDVFFTGPATRNPDGLTHNAVVANSDGSYFVGFEDIRGSAGSDRDFDDNVFRFEGSVAPNQPPTADDQTVATDEDTPVDITLTAHDDDGTVAGYRLVVLPSHGTVSGSGANWTYTPAINYNGPDSFTFEVTDDDGLTDQGTVSIDVRAVNDPPIAIDSAVTTDEDTPVGITFDSTDVDGDPPSYSVVSGPSHGTLSGTGPNRTYTPDANYHGPDQVRFQVADGNGAVAEGVVDITVNSVQDMPVANDDAGTTDENDPVTVNVIANDTDGDGQPLTASLASGPSHGTATCSGQTCTYQPDSNFAGTDTFVYRATDPDGNSDTAEVKITVRRVGVAGRMTGGSYRNRGAARVQQEFALACTAAGGGRLTVTGSAGTFVLTEVLYDLCTHAAGASSGGPKAGFETLRGSGRGTFNGTPGATADWKFTDGGEGAGTTDTVDITVRNAAGVVVIQSSGPITGGNHQAHGA